MTYLSGKRSFQQHSRLYEPLLTVMLAVDAVGIATECMTRGRLDRTPGNISIQAHQFDLWIRFAALLPTEAMVRNLVPDGFQFVFTKAEAQRAGSHPVPVMSGYKGATMAITQSLFVSFFEQHRDWIDDTFGCDTTYWPPLFNFARAIRDFIVHHNGRVHFENPSAPPVHWHHLEYAPADDGKQAVGSDYISTGDMIVLLVELGDTFDQAGCPLPM
jgi:hypothetical protein